MNNLLTKLVAIQSKEAGLPAPLTEVRLVSHRRWRLDYFWPDKTIALECEGGVFSGGRHTRGAGFLKDAEKYNTAAAMGYCLIRLTPSQIRAGELTRWLRLATGQPVPPTAKPRRKGARPK